MKLTTSYCMLNDWYIDNTTKESWFLKNVGNCEKQPLAMENTSCCTFSFLDKESNIPYFGKALFVNQRLKGLELSIQNDNIANRLPQIVAGMLGDPDVKTNDRSYYFFQKTRYSLMKNGTVLLVEFHKTYKKNLFHFDSPLKLSRAYRLRGCSRFFGLAAVLFLTFGYSYNVYKNINFWLETGQEFYLQETIGGAIFVLPFILWVIREILGLYNMEYSHFGKQLKHFCDGKDKDSFYRNLYLLNEELKNVEYKDFNIRITKNFVCIRDFPIALYVVIPKKNIVSSSHGTVTVRTRAGSATNVCIDIKAANGAVYKYTANKKVRMDEVRAMIK